MAIVLIFGLDLENLGGPELLAVDHAEGLAIMFYGQIFLSVDLLVVRPLVNYIQFLVFCKNCYIFCILFGVFLGRCF